MKTLNKEEKLKFTNLSEELAKHGFSFLDEFSNGMKWSKETESWPWVVGIWENDFNNIHDWTVYDNIYGSRDVPTFEEASTILLQRIKQTKMNVENEWKEIDSTDDEAMRWDEIAKWVKGNDSIAIREVTSWIVVKDINGIRETVSFSDRADAYGYVRDFLKKDDK
jgi:hypothetical protein